jgi:hypothetical protein
MPLAVPLFVYKKQKGIDLIIHILGNFAQGGLINLFAFLRMEILVVL